jgi:hypothetical protein
LTLKTGDTFLAPKRSRDTEHLWIVVAEVDAEKRKAICVNITTEQADSDTTCKLAKGDHSFIAHDSVVYYKDAQELDLTAIEAALSAKIQSFVCTQHDPCSEALLKRIKEGLVASKQTPKGIKATCRKLWGIE